MTYDVPISIARDKVLPDVFDWLQEQNIIHMNDWVYTKPDYFKDEWVYTFKFVQQKHAALFALKWA